MNIKKIATLSGLLLANLVLSSASAQTTIIGDAYTGANGTGIALGTGLNVGINPPATRLTGSSTTDLRYILSDTAKTNTAYGINNNRMRVTSATGAGRATLSANGTTAFDFGPALGALAATPDLPAQYDIAIKIDVDSAGTQRSSFALSTVDGNNVNWDFGFQVYRVTATDTNYVIAHRVDAGSSGTDTDVTAVITNNAGLFGSEITIVMRVTDAGAETTDYRSRLQLSLGGTNNWFYDTATDATIANKWRFDGANRFLLWDIAPSALVTYDALSLVSTFAPTTVVKTWTGAGSDDNWSTGVNWGGTAPINGDGLIFAGTTRQANNNDITALTAPFLSFNNGGFSLSGNALILNTGVTNATGINTVVANLSYGVAGNKAWDVKTGSEVVLNNTTTVEVNGDHFLSGGGALRQKGTYNVGLTTTANPAFVVNEGQHIIDGGTFASEGGYRIGSAATGPGAQTILTNNATFTLAVASGNLRVGDSANPVTAQLQIHNSTLTMAGGSLGIPYAAGATGLVTQVGGIVSGGHIVFNDAGDGSGTYTIQNGTLEAIQIREDIGTGFSSLSFDNAVLRTSTGASNTFLNALNLVQILAGGLTFDATSDVTVGQTISGVGALTKIGSGRLTMTGNLNYTGNTLVQSGALVLTTGRTNTANVQVSNGAELNLKVIGAGASRSISSLGMGTGGASTLNFDLTTLGTPTAPILQSSALSASGTVTINVANGLQLSQGQIVLVDYDGTISGGFNFVLGTLPSGVTATLVDNVANSSIDLNITGVPSQRWTGAIDAQWDFSTQNWISLETGLSSTFADAISTEFLDGAANPVVNLTATVKPSAIVVSNNTLPYVFFSVRDSGTSIENVAVIKKYGAASLTRVSGELDFITNIELNAGSYIHTNFYDSTFTTVLSDAGVGTGTFVKHGASKLTATGASTTYDGAILIAEGIYKMGTNSALGSTNGITTISNGATLDVNDFNAPHERVFVSGVGVNGEGAIIDSSPSGAVANNLTDVTLVGHTTFGLPTDGRLDIRVRTATGPGPGLQGNGFNLTKIGSGSLSIACQRHFAVGVQPFWQMNLGDVIVNAGAITFAESLNLGNPSKIIAVAPGATLGTYDLNITNPIARNVFMTNATITGSGGANDTNAFTGTIQIDGVAHLRPLDAKLVFNGPIVGNGSVAVSATGSGALYLNGNNTYTGDTTVTNGIFGGTGIIAGNLIMQSGTNAPGMGVGTLTVNGSGTLAGTTLMELDRSKSPNSDRLVVNGAFSWSGILRVVLGPGAPSPQAGDVYQLFNKGGSGSFSSIVLPNISALPGSLTWDTSTVATDGKIKVNGVSNPPTIETVSYSGGNLIFSGTGGTEGATYNVLSSTNLAAPLATWTAVATNVFGPGGSFSYTNSVAPGTNANFFLLRLQ